MVSRASVLAFIAITLVAAPCALAITDTDILNFALNLEYLEASFYSYAARGVGLDSDLTGGGPEVIGGEKANLTEKGQFFAEALAVDEINHVRLLRSVLGDAAVPIPAIDLGPAFAAAANAALNLTLDPPFTPYANDLFFYHGAFIFEDVGVTAYLGALPSISDTTYVPTAAGIAAVEAYHAGAVRAFLLGDIDTVTPYGVPVSTIVDAIAALRETVQGEPVDAFDLGGSESAPLFVPASANTSVAFSRDPSQILAVVYLGGTDKGGFFPEGLNGNIK
ncbi:hypothetical protein ACKKBG_A32870 [Auxenochlorella protothecoides x Auxenochlorella symbiontica]